MKHSLNSQREALAMMEFALHHALMHSRKVNREIGVPFSDKHIKDLIERSSATLAHLLALKESQPAQYDKFIRFMSGGLSLPRSRSSRRGHHKLS